MSNRSKEQEPVLSDYKIMLLNKVSLDNCSTIIQMSSMLNGAFIYAKPQQSEKWQKDFNNQWKSYQKQVNDILEEIEEHN